MYTSTGVSPFMSMGRRQPGRVCDLSHFCSFDPDTYQSQLKVKLAKLHNLVEANVTQAGHNQKVYYDWHSTQHSFKIGDPVWLSVSTAVNLQFRQEGNWRINQKPHHQWKSQMTNEHESSAPTDYVIMLVVGTLEFSLLMLHHAENSIEVNSEHWLRYQLCWVHSEGITYIFIWRRQ